MSSEDIYQEFILELYKNPLNFGELEGANAQAKSYNPLCGDRIAMQLNIKDGQVAKAMFTGSGCAISQASASLLTEEIKGKRVEELRSWGKDEVLGILRIDLRKNPSRLKCALLSLETLKKACGW